MDGLGSVPGSFSRKPLSPRLQLPTRTKNVARHMGIERWPKGYIFTVPQLQYPLLIGNVRPSDPRFEERFGSPYSSGSGHVWSNPNRSQASMRGGRIAQSQNGGMRRGHSRRYGWRAGGARQMFE